VTARNDGRHGPRPLIRNLAEPDEVLTLQDAVAHTVHVGDLSIGRLVMQPGWRWSTAVRPLAGTDSCQFHHVGLGISGAAHFVMDDGTEFDVRPGDVFDIPPGHDNWVTSDEPAVSIIWGGWRGWGRPPDGDRVLMSLVMTDIEGSTTRLAAVGDAAWDRLLERHHTVTREVVERHRGREVDTTGDGFLLAFDGAARAVHAAVDIRQAVSVIGLQVRVGVHTGEVEVVPGGLRGVTVHETARIMSLGHGGEVLLSDITRDLSLGDQVRYEDRGIHVLKGIPRPRHVFAVA
jgi:class 3 adenylate cyclase/mannose-6-phosphate isomerase-like protein (cupin superfamily)